MHSPCNDRSYEYPEEARQVLELRRSVRAHERAVSCDSREVVAEKDERVCRVIVLAVLKTYRRGPPPVVKTEYPRGKERAVDPVGDSKKTCGRDNEPEGVDALGRVYYAGSYAEGYGEYDREYGRKASSDIFP